MDDRMTLSYLVALPLGALLIASCAGQDPNDPGCPRGQVFREGQCRQLGADGSTPPVDGAPPERDRAVAELDARPADALGDGRIGDGSISEAAVGDAADAHPDGPPADGPLPDMAVDCEPGSRGTCGRNVGTCREGSRVCGNDRSWGPCEGGYVGPADEDCNGVDDDCNGVVDDGFGVGEACDGVGACGAGTLECRNDFQTRCSTDPEGSESAAVAERCNGVDDDCDARIDEDFGVGDACEGECGPGAVECGPGGVPICSSSPGGSDFGVRPEVCNGRDDDCDGAVDEDFDLGAPCAGTGQCGPGVNECDDQGAARCSTDPGGSESAAIAEVCNRLDDDCDGAVDEDFPVNAPCDGIGRCGRGVSECTLDGRIRCSTDPGGSASEAVDERCNGEDDDCDGEIDEALGVGEPCPARGICGAGSRECGPGGAVICDTQLGGSREQAVPELCNGVDDDCDGEVDEDFGVGTPCLGVGACGAGRLECDGVGASQCDTLPGGSNDGASPEICDQIDNDCNGAVDDGAACGGETCENAPGLLLSGTIEGDTTGLANDHQMPRCAGALLGPDQAFRLDPPAGTRYVVGVAPLDPGYDPAVWISRDCPNPTGCDVYANTGGAGRPDAGYLDAALAATYYLIIDAFDPPGGRFVVSIEEASAGETCETALELPVPGRYVGTTDGRSNDASGSACPNGITTNGRDQFFRLNVPRAGLLTVTALPGPANVRPVLYILDACGEVDQRCVQGAVGQAGQPVQIALRIANPGVYYLGVDHGDALTGAFYLTTTLEP